MICSLSCLDAEGPVHLLDNLNPKFDEITRNHWTQARRLSRALLMYRVGALKVKDTWRIFNSTKYGTLACPVPGCSEDDTVDHLFTCQGYECHKVMFNRWDSGELELAEYVMQLSEERFRRFRMPVT